MYHATRAGAEAGGGAQELQAAAVFASHKCKAADAVSSRLEASDRDKYVPSIQRRDNCSGSALMRAKERRSRGIGLQKRVAGRWLGVEGAAGTCCLHDRGSSGSEHVTVRRSAAASQLHIEMLLSSSFATKTMSAWTGCHTRCLRA